MFKHFTLSLAALALLAACSIKDDRLDCLTPVNVHVDGFIISQENLPATKADPVAPGSYSAPAAGSFLLSTGWLDEESVDF